MPLEVQSSYKLFKGGIILLLAIHTTIYVMKVFVYLVVSYCVLRYLWSLRYFSAQLQNALRVIYESEKRGIAMNISGLLVKWQGRRELKKEVHEGVLMGPKSCWLHSDTLNIFGLAIRLIYCGSKSQVCPVYVNTF